MADQGRRHQVVIAGGGPTGIMLAGELRIQGVDGVIVERRTGSEVLGTRARGLHARTIEVLDQRGLAERFLEEGYAAQVLGFAGVKRDISDFPSRHPYGLALVQKHTERFLVGWIEELGVPIARGVVTGFTEDETGVAVALEGGPALRADYLVGCDGGRSLIRKAAGIGFPGWDPTVSNLLAEVEMAETPPQWGFRYDALGMHALSRPVDGGPVGVLLTERSLAHTGEPTLSELSAALIAVYGTDFGVHSPTVISRFTDMTRQAETYRKGRVLLAGDAAHIHYPVGGHGLNLGIQDAVNLGWKLAEVVTGIAPDSLLDTYHAERHPIATRALRETMASVALSRTDERTRALKDIVGELLHVDAARKYLAGIMSELEIRYDLGEGHPLLGRRMPDLDVVTTAGPRRVFTLLHKARPVLLNFGAAGSLAVGPWADRVRVADATCDGPWELPVIGRVPPPSAVLVRPDGYVAWVGEGSAAGLSEALGRWFGPPARA
jgi:2-polyprenyl-6-methoxyphenol hydroxylase-like FAD-dependent oxidoreductase